jgi:hypothetical protein
MRLTPAIIRQRITSEVIDVLIDQLQACRA